MHQFIFLITNYAYSVKHYLQQLILLHKYDFVFQLQQVQPSTNLVRAPVTEMSKIQRTVADSISVTTVEWWPELNAPQTQPSMPTGRNVTGEPM